MTTVVISEQDASDVMDLLMERGYFHNNESNEAQKMLMKEHSSHQSHQSPLSLDDASTYASTYTSTSTTPIYYSSKDPDCQIIQTTNGGYLTRSLLSTKLQQLLTTVGGRLSQTDAAHSLDIRESQLEQCINDTINSNSNDINNSNSNKVISIGEDCLLVSCFFDQLLSSIQPAVLLCQANGASLSVSDIAAANHLPLDLVLDQIKLRLQQQKQQQKQTTAKLITKSGATALIVTPNLERQERARLRGAIRSLVIPTPIDDMMDQNTIANHTHTHNHNQQQHHPAWDASYILDLVRDLLETNDIAGVLHESSTAGAALFVPTIYTTMQRQAMDQHFQALGFVTVATCHSMGIVPSNMGHYVRDTFPTATVLKRVVMDSDRIVNPLIPVLQEAASENSFLDLRLHLPEALLRNDNDDDADDDLLTIVKDMALPQLSERGHIVISNGEVLFVSSGMSNFIINHLLPPLIETFAKEEAERLDAAFNAEVDDGDNHGGAIKKKSSKKSKSKHSTTKRPVLTESLGVVPLSVVAQAVLDAYPDLADIQQSYGSLDNNVGDKPLLWEVDDADNAAAAAAAAESGPVVDLCRQTIYTAPFQDACRLAVNAELERLRSTNKASSVRSRKDGAAKSRSVESSFEDCFTDACQQLLLHAKFLDFVDSSDQGDADKELLLLLQADFLRGSCADFASRITQYCLFKNELEGDVFSFGDDTVEELAGVPRYCQPIDRATRRISHPYLSCIMDDDTQQQAYKPPLPTLRKVLSGSMGVTLARLWTHCGGECYADDGGVQVDANGSTSRVKPGNVNEFLSFVEENCLSICGMPFTKLNKKLEKQFLFARRQELTSALGSTSDPITVLEFTIMLLFQQIRGFTVSGPHLTGPILKLLCKERKIPESIANLLLQVADQCESDGSVDADLVAKVKACGLSRDIAKHDAE